MQDAWTAYDRRTETKEERTTTRTTKRYTSNSSNVLEEVTPQILFLDTKPFVICTDELLQVDVLWFNLIFGLNFLKPVYFFQSSLFYQTSLSIELGCRDGAVLRALTSH